MIISAALFIFPLFAPAIARLIFSANNGTIPDGVIVAPLTVKHSNEHPLPHRNRRSLNKRAPGHEVHLSNHHTYYEIALTIGTPPQSFQCLVDTGSSDLWVSSSENPICNTPAHDRRFGTFTSCWSSTWELNSSTAHDNIFHVRYADNSVANGVWGNDMVRLDGSISLEKCSVGLVTTSFASSGPATLGTLGLGLPAIEGTNIWHTPPYTYPNVPALMAQRGLISRNAYSLYLGDASNNNNGKLIFGGIDTNAFSGTLIPQPLVATRGSPGGIPDRLAITLTSFNLLSSASSKRPVYSKAVGLPVVLDSGASMSYLPLELVKSVRSAVKAVYNTELQEYVTTCSQPGTIQFGFNRVTINVPLSEFLFPLDLPDGRPMNDRNGQRLCSVDILDHQAPGEALPLLTLGVNFLRSAYVLYDLDNKEISVAQAVRNPRGSRIEPLPNTPRPGPSRSHKRDSATSLFNSAADEPAVALAAMDSVPNLAEPVNL